jgi:hypothetical protein
MLGYPDGTVLIPRLFVRNAAEDSVPVEITLNWKSPTSVGRIPIKPSPLAPQETRVLNVSRLQKQGLPKDANWANVSITYLGRPGDLVLLAASYDDSTRYGLQSPFSDNLSFMWKGGMWHYDAQHNSLITTGNGGTKDARVVVKLFYENGTYELPERNLRPGEQIWLDVGELIRNQVPDKKGRVMPLDTMSGSYQIEDLNDSNIGYLYEGKLMTDKTFGHATYGCAPCCGYDNTFLLPDPLGVPVAGGGDFYVWATNACTGIDKQQFGAYNWTSSNHPVATVDQYGYMSGISPGSTAVVSFISLRHPGVNTCPPEIFNQSAPGNVMPQITSIRPQTGAIGATVPVTITGSGFGTNPTLTTNGQITVANKQVNGNGTTITANFQISSSASTGKFTVVVTNITPATTSFSITKSCNPTVVTPSPSPIACDGKTVRQAQLTIGGSDEPNVTNATVSATSSNILTVDLQGTPYTYSTFCPPGETCYDQNYVGYTNTQSKSANVNWSVQIFCSNSPYPSKTVDQSATITCQ